MGSLAREIGGALIISMIFLCTYGLQSRTIPYGLLLAGLTAGLVFTVVQGHRKRTNFLTRAISSAISLVLAGYFLSAVIYLLVSLSSSPYLLVLVPLPLFLAYRLLKTDLRMWSWYGSRVRDESGAREAPC